MVLGVLVVAFSLIEQEILDVFILFLVFHRWWTPHTLHVNWTG